MTRVLWAPQALEDLQSIRTYLARDSPEYADLIVEQIMNAIDRLESHPRSGRVVPEIGQLSFSRSFTVPARFRRGRDAPLLTSLAVLERRIYSDRVDDDLESMTREQLVAEARRLRAGIRKHRDSTGHELCWHHPALWSLLPEKTDPLPSVPAWPEFLRGCLRYRQSLDEQLPDAPRSDTPYRAPDDDS